MNKNFKTTMKKLLNKEFVTKLIVCAVLLALTFIITSFTLNTNDKQINANNDISSNISSQEIVTVEPETTPSIEVVEIEEKEIDKSTIYCVVSGDSFAKIAKDFYGNEEYAYALAEFNGYTDYTIYPLDELKIPDISNIEFANLYNSIKNKPAASSNNQKPKNVTVSRSGAARPAEVEKHEDKPIQQVNTSYKAPTSAGNVKNNPGEVDTTGFTYLGSYKITGYTPGCSHCCGSTSGITASGVKAICGRTIAAKGLEFGTTVYIKGYGFYVVEDRGGFAKGTIDMAAPSHEECYAITTSGVDVYIVPNN